MGIEPRKVDLSPLLAGDEKQWAEVSKTLGNSLHELGAVYLVGHGIDTKLVDEVFKNSKELFNLPVETKKKYSKTDVINNFNGFSAMGAEDLSDLQESAYEVKEAFDINLSKPVFPDVAPEFRTTAERFIGAIESLKRTVFKLLAKVISVDEDIFMKSCNYLDGAPGYTTFRVLRYPQVSADFKIEKGTIRCAEHCDWTAITFLFQDSVGGLEVRTQEGEWIDAPPVPGSIILMAGEILEAWTRGYFPAVYHRILLTEEDERIKRDRHSFGYFIFPDNDFVVQPLDKTEFLSNEFKFEPITAGSHVQAHIMRAY